MSKNDTEAAIAAHAEAAARVKERIDELEGELSRLRLALRGAGSAAEPVNMKTRRTGESLASQICRLLAENKGPMSRKELISRFPNDSRSGYMDATLGRLKRAKKIFSPAHGLYDSQAT